MRTLHDEVLDQIDSHISSDSIRHFYLLTGDGGVGKKTVAKLMAKKILCRETGRGSPCGNCISCRTFEAGSNMDFIFTEPDDGNEEAEDDGEEGKPAKKTGNILIEESRLIMDRLVTKPIISKRKAVIISEAHKMTENARICLLKTLEEPPSYVTIILTCPDKNLLPDTVVSRTFHFTLKPQDKADIKEVLPEATRFALDYGNGNIGRTIDCMDKDYTEQRKKAFRLVKSIITDGIDDIDEKDYIKEIGNISGLLLEIARDMILIKAGSRKIINSDMEEALVKMAKNADYKDIRKMMDRAIKAAELLQINTNKKIAFYNFLYGN